MVDASQNRHTSGPALTARNRILLRAAVIVLIALVAWLKPRFERRKTEPATQAEQSPGRSDAAERGPVSVEKGSDGAKTPTAAAPPLVVADQTQVTPSVQSGSRSNATKPVVQETPREKVRQKTPKPKSDDDPPPPGKLTLLSGGQQQFRSTAGLMYVRGSRDGHRLKHVLKHAKDIPNKEIHGVFQGDRDQILAWIDQAWMKVKARDRSARVQKQGDRTVCTVEMREKIGFVGGRAGARKGRPACRYLRLVVQNENEVVTAYPRDSF